MNLIRKVFTTLGCIFLAALLVTAFVPKAAHGVAAALVQVENTVMTQDVDQPARAPFVVTVTTNAVTNFNYTPVTIPSGQRLVIQNVSITGAAQSIVDNQVEPIQPITILSAGLNGAGSNLYYFAPPQNNQLSTQFYLSTPTTIYADTLAVGPAFAGFTPTFDTFNVVITGYLISNP